ncbi:hypothetical protein MUG84_05970 [Paenibacillus sp. KQZ6P-2]|uniref:Uncharacterized protein n=1 Tax=Paenibacillus mangrovi TaxID=2931978 RepID=A0A9X2B1V8_9BACL|nr:hypothetical protein [Paenibacillus mangrovi]MCJ8011295.1 hypothetical protein [Paenibacillus mangrovi]
MSKWNLSLGIAALLWICVSLTGCGLLQDHKSPEKWFKQTIAGMAGKDSFSFSGEAAVRTQSQKGFRQNMAYEGSLTEHDKLTIRSMLPTQAAEAKSEKSAKANNMHAAKAGFRRQDGHWVHLFSEGNTSLNSSLARFNPLAQLDAISYLPKQIREASGAARGTKVLRIELAPEAAKQWLSDQLGEEMNLIRQQTVAGRKDLTTQEMRQLSDVWNKGNAQMNQMLEHSEVKMVYYLTVDKKSGFPVNLSSESEILYLNQHQQEEKETLVNDVKFHP